jgi:hypothetical protein
MLDYGKAIPTPAAAEDVLVIMRKKRRTFDASKTCWPVESGQLR